MKSPTNAQIVRTLTEIRDGFKTSHKEADGKVRDRYAKRTIQRLDAAIKTIGGLVELRAPRTKREMKWCADNRCAFVTGKIP